MSGNVQSGILQLLLGIGLLFAWWSGALAFLLSGLTAGVRGEQPPAKLWDSITGGTKTLASIPKSRAA